jgi:FolB domain-containing protein
MNTAQFDIVELRDLHVECLVGIHAHERLTSQPLVLQVRLFLERRPGTFGQSLEESMDYSHVAGDLAFLLEAGEFRLLETAAEACCAVVLGPQAPDRMGQKLEAMEVAIQKPLALGGRAIPAIRIFRKRGEFVYKQERNEFGLVDVLHENRDCGIYRLRIRAGGHIPAHFHRAMGEAELVMSDGLLLQERPVPAGVAHFWPLELVHAYRNPTDMERSILCVNRPIFDRSDEIPAAAPETWSEVIPYRKRFFGLPLASELPS